MGQGNLPLNFNKELINMALWPAGWRANLPWAGQAAANVSVTNIEGVLMPALDSEIAMLQKNNWQLVRGVYDFDVSTGATDEYDIFTVTGDVMVRVIGVCETSVTDAAGASRLQVGVTGATTALLAQITGPDLVAGEIWHDATPTTEIEKIDISGSHTAVITGGQDIVMEISGAAVTAGLINFYCYFMPLSADGDVVAA
jgi:hypothetical protein